MNRFLTYLLSLFKWGIKSSERKKFIGFKHYGRLGIRSHIYVFSMSAKVSLIAGEVAKETGSLLIENSNVSVEEQEFRSTYLPFISTLAHHPHTAAIFILSYNQEESMLRELVAVCQQSGTPCEYLDVREYPSFDLATSLAISTANELRTSALSGFDHIDKPQLAVDVGSTPEDFQSLIQLLQRNFEVTISYRGNSRQEDFSKLFTQGFHAILSFPEEIEYPTGTITTPVINVSTSSSLHKQIQPEFDLGTSATNEEILDRVEQAFGMLKSIAELRGIWEPLFTGNIPVEKGSDGPNQICLIPLSLELSHFLSHFVEHNPSFFLRSLPNSGLLKINASKILLISIAETIQVPQGLTGQDSRVGRINLAECGSLLVLAEKILQHK
jgi:hypothetical protein